MPSAAESGLTTVPFFGFLIEFNCFLVGGTSVPGMSASGAALVGFDGAVGGSAAKTETERSKQLANKSFFIETPFEKLLKVLNLRDVRKITEISIVI